MLHLNRFQTQVDPVKTIKEISKAVAVSAIDTGRRALAEVNDLRARIAESSRTAKSEIEKLRAAIEREKRNLADIERAPASAAEIEQRVNSFVDSARAAAREGRFYGLFAGEVFNPNKAWIALDHQKPFEFLAVVTPEQLKKSLIAEAKQVAADSGVPALSVAERQSAIARLTATIRALEGQEEIILRDLDAAGMSVARRRDASRDVIDATTNQLEVWNR